MKYLNYIFAICFLTHSALAQNVGIGTSMPDPSSKLEIASDSSGILVPRMTATERDSIAEPATGLLVFVTDDSTFHYFDGAAWVTFDQRTRGLTDTDRDTRIEVESMPDDDIIRFIARDSQIMIIDSMGNIGIGDTFPVEALSLKGGNLLQTPFSPVLVGSLPLGGTAPTALYVSGHYAYMPDSGTGELKVVDVSNPKAPELVGSVSTGGLTSISVFVSARYAYVIDPINNDLKVIDVSDPSAPVVTSSYFVGQSPGSVYVSGNYAYVTDGNADDLRVVDVSDPYKPMLTDSIVVGADPSAVFVSGRYAYVVNRTSDDLAVIDVSDPHALAMAGSMSTGDFPYDVYVSGRYAYVVNQGSADLAVIDVSDPGAPAVTGTVDIGTSPSAIFVSGRYAFVVDDDTNDLKVVDVSDPGAPVVAGSLGIGTTPNAVYVSGRYAYVTDSGSDDLKIIDISGAEVTSMMTHSLEAGNLQVRNDIIAQGQLQVAGAVNIGTGGLFSAGNMGVAGSLSLRRGSLLQTPFDPVLVGSLPLGGTAPTALYVSGRYAYMPDSGTGELKVVDVSNPKVPELVGSVNTGGLTSISVFVSGRYAYVIDPINNDLKVIDVSDPSAPVVTSSYFVGQSPGSVYVSGRYAYVTDGNADDLRVIDVSDPFSPMLTDNIAVGTDPASVFVSGRYAYVVNRTTDDLVVIDISDPHALTMAGNVPTGDFPYDVYVSGRYAYVVNQGSDDLAVIDVSDPGAPTVTGTVDIGTSPSAIFVSGRYVFIVDDDTNDLKVVDVSDPGAPVVAGSLGIGTTPNAVYVSGRYAYVTDSGSDDLKIIDISGAEVTSMMAHSFEAGNLQVRNDIVAQGQLQVTGGVNVGAGGLYSDGNLGVEGEIYVSNALGIGSVNPRERLDIHNGFGNAGIRINSKDGDTTSLKIFEGSGFGFELQYDGIGDQLHLWSRKFSGNEDIRMTWEKNGNVGIGTTAASENLVVGDDIGSYTGNRITIGDNGNFSGINMGENGNDRAFLLFNPTDHYFKIGTVNAGASYDNTLVARDGKIGIRTSDVNNDLTIKQGGLTTDHGLRLVSSSSSDNWTMYYDGSGYLAFAKNGTCQTRLDNSGAFVACSDSSLKEQILPLENVLDRVVQLSPVTYQFKDPARRSQSGRSLGFIAQEVEPLFPQLVTECADGIKGVNYGGFSMIAIKAVQELAEQNATQQDRIEELRIENEELRSHVELLSLEFARLRALVETSTPGGVPDAR